MRRRRRLARRRAEARPDAATSSNRDVVSGTCIRRTLQLDMQSDAILWVASTGCWHDGSWVSRDRESEHNLRRWHLPITMAIANGLGQGLCHHSQQMFCKAPLASGASAQWSPWGSTGACS